jgi:hypothetical protein
MPSEQEMAYHRSFLSRYYVHQVVADIKNGSANRMTDDEIVQLRRDDPVAFEEARKALAQLLGVPYQPARSVDTSRGDVGSRYVYIDGVPSNAQVVQFLRPRNPPQVNPTTRTPAIPNVGVGVIDAYLDGNVLLRTTMWSKIDQEFDDYASPWEKIYSALMAPYYSGYTPAYAFTPVVDESWHVIGYYGTMSGGPGSGFLVPEGTKQKMRTYNLAGAGMKEFLEKQVPIMAWPRRMGRVPGWESGDFGYSDSIYGVRTQCDGRVLWVQAVGERGVEATWQPTDVFFAGKALLSLGKLGVGLTQALRAKAARSAGQAVLDGATKEAAEAAMRKLDEEIAVASRDLIQDPGKNKAFGRALSHADMQQLIRSRWSQNPFLRRFRSAYGMAGEARKKEIIAALEEMENQTGKAVQVVPEGLGKAGGYFEGAAGWALNADTKQQVLAIAESAFRDPQVLYNEVVHDVAFDVVREASGVPYLRDFIASAQTQQMKGATWWMEQFIMRADEGLDFLSDVDEP